MPVLSRPPRHPRLADLVELLWFTDTDPSPVAQQERVLPNGRAQLIVSCGDQPFDSILIGPKSRAVDIGAGAGRCAGVAFTAGGLGAFAGWSVEEVAEATLPLGEIGLFTWNVERTLTQGGPAVLDLLESMLLEHLRVNPKTGAVRAAERALRSGMPASDLAGSLGLDRRTFVPEFRRQIGFAPKHYQRILRFQQALLLMRQEHPPTLATIAADLGFSDQAHLSREVAQFAGLSPSQLWGSATAAHNHVVADRIFKT